MQRVLLWAVAAVAVMIGAAAKAQDQVWVQIEARQTLQDATERAEAYAAIFPDVAGFELPSGWFAIALGPFPEVTAQSRLISLRDDRMIPADSFLARDAGLGTQFWPRAEDPAPAAVPDAETAVPSPAPTPDPVPPAETMEQAQAAEAALPQADREAIQTALQWFGHYSAAIDGRIGSGSRAAIAAWQTAEGAEPTGVLTTAQRLALVGAHQAAMTDLGLTRVTEAEAGIEIDLPLGLVEFDRYEPPFVRYRPRNDSGVQVILISEPGDQTTLFGLYDLMQSLDLMPPDGPRERGDLSFTLSGRDGRIESHASVKLSGGLIKGYLLVWPLAEGDRMARVLAAMEASFRPIGERALDPGLAPLSQDVRDGLLTGLDPRRPVLSRSGFFIDAEGTVLTSTDVLRNCARLTIDAGEPVDLAMADPGSGLAVLRPHRPLVPPAHATFQQDPERVGAEIAVAGYSFEDALTAPAMTFGRIGALQGLSGEAGLNRLDLAALPGDAGGPVVDGTGTVMGLLLPPDTASPRSLPAGVTFAIPSAAITALLAAKGIAFSASAARGALPPEELTRQTRAMTVLVSCWK